MGSPPELVFWSFIWPHLFLKLEILSLNGHISHGFGLNFEDGVGLVIVASKSVTARLSSLEGK